MSDNDNICIDKSFDEIRNIICEKIARLIIMYEEDNL